MATLEKNLIPYGVQNFADIRRRGLYYVDKTRYIRELEIRSDKLFLVRPRRMGKSLFVDMLARYYDISEKDNFETYFGGLEIGRRPTELANTFYVLRLDFSQVNKGSGKSLEERFNNYLWVALRDFVDRYAKDLGDDVRSLYDERDAGRLADAVFARAERGGLPVYVIIDEYDNFTNQLIKTSGVKEYEGVTHGDGFYREWFKLFKAHASRLFMTGVSPVTMDDLTSGFNVATNVSGEKKLNAMIGFTQEEVRRIVTDFNGVGECRVDVEACVAELKRLYDGYCFSRHCLGQTDEVKETVFNSSMVFYYLQSLVVNGMPPDSLIDRNIRSDWGKLDYILSVQRHLESFDGVLPLTEELAANGEVTFGLVDAFQIKEIAEVENFNSLYFYYGIVTLSRTARGKLYFRVPNECVRLQVLEYMREQYEKLPGAEELSKFYDLHVALVWDGEWRPFFDYVSQRLDAAWSNRDGLNGEMLVNGFVRANLMLNPAFMVRPELELGHRNSDYSVFPDRSLDETRSAKHSYVIELKYSKKGEGESEIAAKRDEALAQLKAYAQDPALPALAAGTPVHFLYLHYQGFRQIAAEEIRF